MGLDDRDYMRRGKKDWRSRAGSREQRTNWNDTKARVEMGGTPPHNPRGKPHFQLDPHASDFTLDAFAIGVFLLCITIFPAWAKSHGLKDQGPLERPLTGVYHDFRNTLPNHMTLVTVTSLNPDPNDYLIGFTSTETGNPVVSLYIRGGTSTNILLSPGEYTLNGASGPHWYGKTRLFGLGTNAEKSVETVNVPAMATDTIILNPKDKGNIRMRQADYDLGNFQKAN